MKHILDLKGGLRYGWISGTLKFFFLLLQTSGGRKVRTGKACHGKNKKCSKFSKWRSLYLNTLLSNINVLYIKYMYLYFHHQGFSNIVVFWYWHTIV